MIHGLPNFQLLYLTLFAGFNEFIHERETKPPNHPSIMLFDQIILSKRNRGRTSFFNKSNTNFLSNTSDHLWRSAAATPPKGRVPGDYRAVITRSLYPPFAALDASFSRSPHLLPTNPFFFLLSQSPAANRHVLAPAKLDITMMKEPRAIQGVPRINASNARRKPIPSMLGPMGRMNGLAQSPPT